MLRSLHSAWQRIKPVQPEPLARPRRYILLTLLTIHLRYTLPHTHPFSSSSPHPSIHPPFTMASMDIDKPLDEVRPRDPRHP